MDEMDFFDIVSLQESQDLEVKDARGADGKGTVPKSFWATYSAMANTEGGCIALGVEQKRQGFVACGIPDIEKVTKELWDALNNTQKVSINLLSPSCVQVRVFSGQKTVWIQVPRASRKQRPVYLNGNPLTGTYRRGYEGDYRCPEDVVKQMLAEQTNDTRDGLLLDRFGMEDISLATLQLYRQHFANRRPTHPFNDCDNTEFLRNIGGWVKDRPSGVQGLSLAGLLMFGQLRAILDAVPNYIVDYQERPQDTTELRWEHRITTDFTWSGNLYDFYHSVIPRLYSNLKVPFAMVGDTRVDDSPIHVALREALVNTLIHADYAGNCSLLVVKRPDCFEFRNPGLLRLPREEVLRGGNSDCRNRNLQKMFQLIGLGEQAGSGVPKIYHSWDSQHLKQPKLEERSDINQTILSLEMASLVPQNAVTSLQIMMGPKVFDNLNKTERLAVVIALTEGCVTHRRLMELLHIHPRDLTVTLHGLVDRGLLESENATRGTFYFLPGRHPIEDADRGSSVAPEFDRNSPHTGAGSVHNETSSVHKEASSVHSEHVLPEIQQRERQEKKLHDLAAHVSSQKRVDPSVMRLTIAAMCAIRELSMQEMAALLKRSEETLRTHYVSPLCEKGFLVRKFPNLLNHPKQKYRTAIPKEQARDRENNP